MKAIANYSSSIGTVENVSRLGCVTNSSVQKPEVGIKPEIGMIGPEVEMIRPHLYIC